MATIKDVAEAAGVSTATVSRVLSNKPHVRPKLREQVLTAVAELDYRPNLVARSLRSQQTKTIGLIVSDVRNPFFTAISRVVEDVAYEKGYSVFLCNTDEDPKKEMLYLSLMRDENVAGIIFSPTRQTAANFSKQSLNIPVVIIDRSVDADNVDMVLIDNVASACRLTTHLIENGYRRIAAILGEASTTGRQRHQGYADALKTHGIPYTAELVRYVQPKTSGGQRAALDLLALPEPPDAIFTTNSLLMAGALTAIREIGWRIPDDVALVGFDDTIWSALVQPAITLIAQPTKEIGQTATELLLQRVANPEQAVRQVILKGQLIVRGSSAPRQ
jgi:LacI family transcriptional regulator, fructose operon transcriptional repressor